MASEWYYTQNGQQAPAPVSSSQLAQLASSGQVQPTDMVWKEGMANWVQASTIKGLFAGAGKPAATDQVLPVVEQAPARPTERRRRRDRARDRAERGEEEEGETRKAAEDEAPQMHPLLVLLLTAVTCGVFGLYYAYRVCSAYTALAERREADSAGRPLGKARHPLAILILGYLTLGYYFFYWVYSVMRECSDYTGRKDFNPRVELALMLIFPLYSVYVAVFRLPEMIRSVQATAKVPESTAVNHSYIFLNPCMLCAMPYLGMVYQDALNQVWFSAP
jgi:hypothetical protein